MCVHYWDILIFWGVKCICSYHLYFTWLVIYCKFIYRYNCGLCIVCHSLTLKYWYLMCLPVYSSCWVVAFHCMLSIKVFSHHSDSSVDNSREMFGLTDLTSLWLLCAQEGNFKLMPIKCEEWALFGHCGVSTRRQKMTVVWTVSFHRAVKRNFYSRTGPWNQLDYSVEKLCFELYQDFFFALHPSVNKGFCWQKWKWPLIRLVLPSYNGNNTCGVTHSCNRNNAIEKMQLLKMCQLLHLKYWIISLFFSFRKQNNLTRIHYRHYQQPCLKSHSSSLLSSIWTQMKSGNFLHPPDMIWSPSSFTIWNQTLHLRSVCPSLRKKVL